MIDLKEYLPLAFTSLSFYLFAALTLLLYYLLPKRWQWLVVMLASIAFYATYGLEKFPFLIAASLIAYVAARRMDVCQRETEKAAEAKKKCKPVLFLAVGGLIVLWLYAKIGTWVMQSIGAALKIGGAETSKAIAALGVSYYTLSLVAYLADIYWRKDKAEKNYFRLLAFMIYFPKILQGPISRHRELAPQLFEEHRFDYRQMCFGLQRMVWGYFKKLVIADRLLVFVDTAFGHVAEETGAHLLVAAVFSVVQIYADFSGCMDIACGFSECLGLKLEENFDRPFFSRSAAEFWRRWHITLGAWFKDYVYLPIVISPKIVFLSKQIRKKHGEKAAKTVITLLPAAVVWALTAFWHGTNRSYLLWGIYWFLLTTLPTIFAPELNRLTDALHINTQARSWRVFQMVRTFLLFAVCRILVAPGSIRKSLLVFQKIFTEFHVAGLVDGSLYTQGLDRQNFLLGLVGIFVLWVVGMLGRNGSVRERIAGSNFVFRWAIYYILIFSVIIFGMYGPEYDAAAFVYMNF